MAITAYCKKCRQDVPVGEYCPLCGGKLARSAQRVAWCVRHRPVRDWLCWNSAARIALPGLAAVLALVLLAEGATRGTAAVQQMLAGGLLTTALWLLGAFVLVMLLVLLLQGDTLIDCIIDSRGVHVQQYLLSPTPVKLMARLRSPALMQSIDPDAGEPMVLVGQKEIAWRDVARIQLWPEKQLILIYAPRWWMRLAIYAIPVNWDDTLDFIREKLGKKKDVILPYELTAQAPPRASAPAAPVQEEEVVLPEAEPMVMIDEAVEAEAPDPALTTPEDGV